jgi:tetratricopeptide (TPR) repeat protein
MESGIRQGTARPRQMWLTGLLLVIATAAVYWPVRHFQFLNYDDSTIFTDNPHVTDGLTWRNIVWGATTCYYEYWHPLMWWSHMLDCQLFGMNAGAHHLVNLGFHVANTLLVFVVFTRMTGMVWRSAMVAALFGLHPLHVESVAWLAERKDLLSTFFWLLSVWAYAVYVEKSEVQSPRSKVYYGLALLMLLLGLLSKPMVVTLPFVLLLLDYWPLNRMGDWRFRILDLKKGGSKDTVGWRVREKWPFFGLTALFCFITWYSVNLGNYIVSSDRLPLAERLSNIPVAYVRYLWKTVFIGHTAVVYLMPKEVPGWEAAGAGLLLLMISWWVLRMRQARYLAFGWFLFVGMLVPTIGLVPVGSQAMAERYMYLPVTGLLAALVWGAADISAGWKHRQLISGAVAALVLVTCGGVTRSQVRYWHDSVSLWGHCAAENPESTVALCLYGDALSDANEPARAMEQYAAALRLDPSDAETYAKLGGVRLKSGDFDGAAADLENVIRLRTPRAMDYVNLGKAYAGGGKSDAAKECFRTAVTIDSSCAAAHYCIGVEYLKDGNFDGAITSLEKAVELDPGKAAAHACLAAAYSSQGQPARAIKEYRTALAFDSKLSDAENNLAWILATSPDAALRDGAEAVKLARSACEQTSWGQTIMVGTLAAAYAEAGDFETAIQTSQKACELASQRGETNVLQRNQVLLDGYKKHQPAREGD